jgi:hypothetical protein
MKSTIFWVAVLCSSVEVHQSFRGIYYHITRLNEQAKQGGLNQTTIELQPKRSGDSDYDLVGCDTVYFGLYVPTFCRNVLAPIPESNLKKETAGFF